MYAINVRKDQWSFDVETITPEKAAQILAVSNFKNRKLRQVVVGKYAVMMAKGDWKLSPEAIVISNTGRLLNGQHRLSAVVKSGVPCRFLTIRGPDDDVFSVLDRGAVRTTADALQSDKRATECARLIVTAKHGNNSKTTDPEVERVLGKISSTHEAIIGHCSTVAQLFSSAPFRLAATARIMSGVREEYILSLYRDLVLAHINDLPPVGVAVVKMHLNGRAKATGGLAVQIKTLGLAWSVFDPSKQFNERVVYPQSRHYIQEVLEAVGYDKT